MAQSFISAQLGGQWFAIEACGVQEVLGARPWLPLAGQRFSGVMAWRGGAIAVLDLGLVTGFGPPLQAGTVRQRNAVVRCSQATFALPVDAVREVSDTLPEDIIAFAEAKNSFCRRVASIDELSALVVDFERVVDWLFDRASGA